MRGIKFVSLVAVAIAGLTLSTGVGASTGKAGASAKVSGAHIQKVIVNGTVQKNAAIPARVKRILKRATEIPGRICPNATSSSPGSNTAVQSCTWGSLTTPYTGPVTCIQISTKATASQTCDITQLSAGANNTALIIQIIWSQNPPPPSGQDGTQIVKVRQTNTSPSNANNTGGNRAGISQYIRQSLGRGTPDDTEEGDVESDAPATLSTTQKQESHQIVHLGQDSVVGANNAPILQFLRQRERASHSATTNQDQNVDSGAMHPDSICESDPSDALPGSVIVDPNANQCILSNQTSVSGTQSLGLGGDYNQFQRARKAGSGRQVQGVPFTGGSDYGLIQDSTGVSNVLTVQNERQVQRGIQVGSAANFLQSQNGPRKGSGSAQLGNPADTWIGRQTSTQIQTRTLLPSFMKVADELPPSGQTNILVYSAQQHPAGTMDVKQTATRNNGTPVTNSCSASPCEIAIVCAFGESCTPTPNCAGGEGGSVIDPTTGQCENFCTVFPSQCDFYLTSTTPSSVYRRNLYTHRR
jgi:hypothetical protein